MEILICRVVLVIAKIFIHGHTGFIEIHTTKRREQNTTRRIVRGHENDERGQTSLSLVSFTFIPTFVSIPFPQSLSILLGNNFFHDAGVSETGRVARAGVCHSTIAKRGNQRFRFKQEGRILCLIAWTTR